MLARYIFSDPRELSVFSSKAWAQWVVLNANNLAWIMLVVAGVVFSSLLV